MEERREGSPREGLLPLPSSPAAAITTATLTVTASGASVPAALNGREEKQLLLPSPVSPSPSPPSPSSRSPPQGKVPSPARVQTGPSVPPPAPVMRRPPGGGRLGRPSQVLANYFRVSFDAKNQEIEVHQYDVSIEPAGGMGGSGLNKDVSRQVMAKTCQVYGTQELQGKKIVYDGEKCAFTVGPLPNKHFEFSVFLEGSRRAHSVAEENTKRQKVQSGGGREFKVKIEYTTTIRMSAIDTVLKGERGDHRAQDALRVIDTVLRQRAAERGYLLMREKYFSPSFGVADIGEGVQACQGFHASFRPTMQGLSLNLDIATTTVFKPMPILDFIREHLKPPDSKSIDWNRVKKVLKGVRVITCHNNMEHRISGVSDEPCSKLSFVRRKKDAEDNDEENSITVAEYYFIQYKINLMLPDAPCLQTGKGKRINYIPPELCKIVEGQPYKKNLTSLQRQKMIDQARQTPEQRKSVVQKAMETSGYDSDEMLRYFKIKIDGRMSAIPARQLEPPSLKFKNLEEVPQRGRWNLNNKVMASGVQINNWVVLSFDPRLPEPAAKRIVQDLMRVCESKGMNLNAPRGYFPLPRNLQNCSAIEKVENMINMLKSSVSSPPEFMLCILPERKTCDIYGPFKKILQTKLGISSQCIAPPRQVKDQYLTNVALKINAKVGGYNSWLSLEFQKRLPKISDVPTIIFGLDVSHGSPGNANSPSIAAVVASREWPLISKYGVRVRAQSPKVEMIEGLFEAGDGNNGGGGIIMDLLRDFYISCQNVPGVQDRRPKRIIIFRDGVSESQFDQVLAIEVRAFRQACLTIDKTGNYQPRITLLVAQKNHHTRFFPSGSQGNVNPGTIIDTAVCHPRDYDFYLCAHAGIIGTTRPTHYYVLLDENEFTVDEIHTMTHSLCYTYARSTTAISIVAPVAYAHLAAMHARNFLDSDTDSETSSLTGRSNQSFSKRLASLHDKMKSKMFYC